MPDATTATTSPPRILVVEDEALIAEEIQDRLLRMKFQVVGVADDGQRALDAVAALQPDLILMDIRLKGGLDGIDAAAAIRAMHNIPVVYLTAHSDPATLSRARETAPFGYILKPIHERELEVTIEMALHRHALERRLRESELRYAATLASINDAVLATDREGRITFLNPVAEALTGWRAAEVLGQPADRVLVLVDEATEAQIVSPIRQVLALRRAMRLKTPTLLVGRDGASIPIDDSAAPILGADGEVMGVVVAFHDIRDRRLTEEALKKAEADLRHAQKMESIGQLAGGVAHDFNNALTAINGYCEILLRSADLTSPDAEIVRQILSASGRSAQLTGQLLAFSRQQVLNPRIVDLNVLVSGLESLLRRLIGEHILLEVRAGANLGAVRVDPARIEQALLNLCANARDAMAEGGRLIIETYNFNQEVSTVDSRPSMPQGDYVCLTVTDTGVGMDQATLGRLFEPFFTTKAHGKGTGLGLAMVYGVVKQSGGFIYVYSELGRGSVFRIFLPVVAAALTPVEPETNRGSPAGTETVLLAEDDFAVREVATEALRSYGYTVIPVGDGQAAIETYERERYGIDALITDTIMPQLGGAQLVRRLRSLRPDLPVVFMSGYAGGMEDFSPAELDNAKFVQKPFKGPDLASAVRAALDSRSRPT